MGETNMLLDDLRQRTRSFTGRLSESDVIALGRDLAVELVRAHGETPARHPSLDPARIALRDGKPVLADNQAGGDVAADLFELGALLNSLASGAVAEVAWQLDGPPASAASSIVRRYVLAALGSPDPAVQFPTAKAALDALESALAPVARVPASWALHRGDAARRGSRDAKPGATRLEPVWESPVGPTVASPVIAGAWVVALTADGRLVFLDRTTGRQLHELRLAAAAESSPAVVGDLLLVGTDDGDLAIVNLLDGTLRQRVKLGQMVRSSPLADGTRAWIGVIEPKNLGSLVALDTDTGKPVWKRKLGPVFSSPAAAAGRVVIGSDDGSLQAFDAQTGAPAWSARLSGKVRATPTLTDSVAVVGDFGGRVSALNLSDGSPVWSRELGQPIYSSAAIAGGVCVVGCHDGSLRGLDLKSGEVRFEARTRGPVIASPVAVGDRFFVGSTDGDAYLLDATGTVLQRATAAAGGGIQSSAAVDEDRVVFGSSRGLHAMALGS
jgi:outer membrane protein assembly factor BamB